MLVNKYEIRSKTSSILHESSLVLLRRPSKRYIDVYLYKKSIFRSIEKGKKKIKSNKKRKKETK